MMLLSRSISLVRFAQLALCKLIDSSLHRPKTHFNTSLLRCYNATIINQWLRAFGNSKKRKIEHFSFTILPWKYMGRKIKKKQTHNILKNPPYFLKAIIVNIIFYIKIQIFWRSEWRSFFVTLTSVLVDSENEMKWNFHNRLLSNN